jgi:hypothetical protein
MVRKLPRETMHETIVDEKNSYISAMNLGREQV